MQLSSCLFHQVSIPTKSFRRPYCIDSVIRVRSIDRSIDAVDSVDGVNTSISAHAMVSTLTVFTSTVIDMDTAVDNDSVDVNSFDILD